VGIDADEFKLAPQKFTISIFTVNELTLPAAEGISGRLSERIFRIYLQRKLLITEFQIFADRRLQPLESLPRNNFS
jgi:hypothetical protein